jgi:hypothetical protein
MPPAYDASKKSAGSGEAYATIAPASRVRLSAQPRLTDVNE